MKLMLLLLTVCIAYAVDITEIKPLLGVPFGTISVIEFTAVEKPNTYYMQNIVKAKFLIELNAINGNRVDRNVHIVPSIDDSDDYVIGNKYKVRAYEKINTISAPKGWNVDGLAQQIDYFIERTVVITRNGLTSR